MIAGIGLLLLAAVLFPRHSPRAAAARRATAEVSDLILIRKEQKGIFGYYRVLAKVTNTGAAPLVLPVFDVSVDSDPKINKCVAGFILASGESAIFIGGGETSTPERLRSANGARVALSYSDPYTDAEFIAQQLRYRPKLQIVLTAMEFHPENDSATVHVRFDNLSGRDIALIQGTAIFLDRDGVVVDASVFVYDPKVEHPYGIWLSQVPRAATAQRCIFQIDSFRERNQAIPDSVPVPPSVH